MAQYTFRVTGKGIYKAPKGAVVQVVKSSSTITMSDIKDAPFPKDTKWRVVSES